MPAFLLLHGFKECGWDNWWQTNAGLALLLQNEQWARWFPGIVVIPQLPRRPWDEQWWQHWRTPAMQSLALACLEKAVKKYSADRKRLYLLGESLGTEGAWYLAGANPGYFAAIGGSCGSVEPYDWNNFEWGSSPESFKKLAADIGKDTPMWFCHGREDDFVPIEQSRKFYEALLDSRQSSAVGAILGRTESAEVTFKEYEAVAAPVFVGDEVEILIENTAESIRDDRKGTKGMIGNVVEDDGSSQPYKVKLPNGREEWYKKGWIQKASGGHHAHHVWNQAYEEDDVITWLTQQKKA